MLVKSKWGSWCLFLSDCRLTSPPAGAFLFCWTPFFVLHTMRARCQDCHVPAALMSVVTWLGYVNSALNPVIYTVFNTEFRNFFKKFLHRCCSKNARWGRRRCCTDDFKMHSSWKRCYWWLIYVCSLCTLPLFHSSVRFLFFYMWRQQSLFELHVSCDEASAWGTNCSEDQQHIYITQPTRTDFICWNSSFQNKSFH